MDTVCVEVQNAYVYMHEMPQIFEYCPKKTGRFDDVVCVCACVCKIFEW